eukprot:350272_1
MFPLNLISTTICCLYKCFTNKNNCNYCCCCINNKEESEPRSPNINTELLPQNKTKSKTIAQKIHSKVPIPEIIDEYAPEDDTRIRVGSGCNFKYQFQFSPTESGIPISTPINITSEIFTEWQSNGLHNKNDNHIECIKNPHNICLSIKRIRFIQIWYNEYMYDPDQCDLSTNSQLSGINIGNNNNINETIIDFICKGLNYSFIELINDFLHFKQFHFNYKFDKNILNNIYNEFSNTNIPCHKKNKQDRNNMWAFCMAQNRNNRNKYECNENVYNKLELYNLENINYTKNKQDTKLILMAYLDSIHCFIFHSYLFDNDVNNITHCNNDINKFITQIKPYEYKNIKHQENKESETFVVGSDLWDIDGTRYFYSVYNNLKDELLHNELYRLEMHEWNDTYKQCKLFTRCKYYTTIVSLRDSK